MSCVAVQIELKVGKNSEPTTVAGAIAGKVREGTRVCLSGVGPESVYNMLFAVAYARQYLKDDAVDLRFLAEFLEIDYDGEVRTGIRMNVLAEQI